MTNEDLTEEHRNILKVLQQDQRLKLREIHDGLVELEDSRFGYSPDFGDGWNDERREIIDLRDDLDDRNLIWNEYQDWSLTQDGRDILSR